MKHNNKNFKLKFPYLYMLLGYLAIILIGCLVLMLPISTTNGIAFVDSLFVTTSAVCITGLSSVVLIDTFTRFGQFVIMLLVQIGGLGFVTVMTSAFTLFGIKLGLSDKFLIEENMGSQRLKLRSFLGRVLLITAIIECIGFILNMIALRNDYSGADLVFFSLFQSVSAFNNAGFDLFGANSLIDYSENWLLLLSTATMTVLGGLGTIVINEVITVRRLRRLTAHSKIVLTITPILLFGGGLGFFFSEWGNITFGEAMFMSAMARTCGFSVADFTTWKSSSMMLCDLLMFIGGAPASTAGGIKCTTFFVVVVALFSFMRGKPTTAFKRSISPRIVSRSMLITVTTLICVFLTVFIICYFEPGVCTDYIVLETVSAFANVGFSANLTTTLTVGSKLMLCLAMFYGRIGCMTVLMLLRRNWNHKEEDVIRYAEADVLVG